MIDSITLSSRDVSDASYRSLRVRGCPPGVAAEAAHAVVYLQSVRRCGLAMLNALLSQPADSIGPATSVHPAGGGDTVDGETRSALLLGAPLLGLLIEEARPHGHMTIRRLSHAVALEAWMAQGSKQQGLAFMAATSAGLIVAVQPGASRTGSAWRKALEGPPLDVVLTCAPAAAAHTLTPPLSGWSMGCIDTATWQSIERTARKFLVHDTAMLDNAPVTSY